LFSLCLDQVCWGSFVFILSTAVGGNLVTPIFSCFMLLRVLRACGKPHYRV
jgi:hypothetical protein